MENLTYPTNPSAISGGSAESEKGMDSRYFIVGFGLFLLMNGIVIVATIACIKCFNKTKVYIKDNVLTIKSFTCHHEICLQDLSSVNRTHKPHLSKAEIANKAIEMNIRRSQIKEPPLAQPECSRTVTYVMPDYDVLGPVQPIYSEIKN